MREFVYLGSLIAQSSNGDPLSGGAGWVGAGLLGLVLTWLLLRHLPEKDRQLRDLIDIHLKAEREQREDFREALEKVIERDQARFDNLNMAIKSDLSSLQKIAEVICGQLRGKS